MLILIFYIYCLSFDCYQCTALQAETGQMISRVVTFAPNEIEQCIDFEVVDDNIALEETEMFTWTIMIQGDPNLVTIGDNGSTNINVLDDDGTHPHSSHTLTYFTHPKLHE